MINRNLLLSINGIILFSEGRQIFLDKGCAQKRVTVHSYASLAHARGYGAGGGDRTRAYRMDACRSATEPHQQSSGADGGGRTRNLPVTRGMLCPLSYTSKARHGGRGLPPSSSCVCSMLMGHGDRVVVQAPSRKQKSKRTIVFLIVAHCKTP